MSYDCWCESDRAAASVFDALADPAYSGSVMVKMFIQYGLAGLAALFAGPVAAAMLRLAAGPDGRGPVSALLSASPALAWLIAVGVIGLAGGIGIVSAKFVNFRWGLLCAGLVLAWVASACGDLEASIRATAPGSPMIKLAIDGTLLMLLGAGAAAGIQRFASDRAVWAEGRAAPAVTFGLGVAISAVCAAAASFLVAQTSMTGQAVFAACCGAMFAGVLLRAMHIAAPAWAILLGIMLVAAAGPLIAEATSRSAVELVRTVNAGGGPPLARVLGWDWLAGSFIGLSVGLAWNSHSHEPEAGRLAGEVGRVAASGKA